MKKIPLTQGRFAVVDDDDFERINKFKWCYHSTGYAMRRSEKFNGKSKILRMHREILNLLPLFLVDHIDCNKLNNSKLNLRTATNLENMRNRPRRKKNRNKINESRRAKRQENKRAKAI